MLEELKYCYRFVSPPLQLSKIITNYTAVSKILPINSVFYIFELSLRLTSFTLDWSSSKSTSGRVSSFMVYLEANCTGGGTNFPRLERPKDKNWCRFIECREGEGNGTGQQSVEGVTFKPIKGNAVFWENLRSDGTGYKESWHAGLPVKGGTKIGLNIWSWYQEGT